MLNSDLRKALPLIVSVFIEVGGSEFNVLSAGFESFNILLKRVNIFDVSGNILNRSLQSHFCY